MMKFRMTIVLAGLLSCLQLLALDVDHLRVMSLVNPSPVDMKEPNFSWQLQSEEYGVLQTSYQLSVSTDAEGADVVWTSGVVESDQSVRVVAKGITLQPATRYYWRVSVTDNHGNSATSTETAWFETGLMTSGWSGAQWIKAAPLSLSEAEEAPKDYIVEGKVRIERTAAGLCFAMQDAGNFYFWQLNTEGSNPRLRPHVWSGGNPACLANVDLSGKVELNNTDEFTLRIEVTNASTAVTYINGVKVDERTGNFKFGRVGMREDHGEVDSREEIGVYDDIKVTTPDGTVLFSEDFSDGNHFTGGTVIDGKLRIVGSTQQSVYAWQNADAGAKIHYALDYDMRLVKAAAAVIFAATSGNTYHMWQINCHDNDNPAVRHHVYVNGNLTWNDSQFTQFTKAQLTGSTHHYRIEVEGSQIKTFVDGILVDTYTSAGSTAMGDIGMRVDNSTGEEAYYDNLVLMEYDGEGNATVRLSEDFEQLSSAYFYDADVETIDGNRMCHVKSASGEKKVMQAATEGQAPLFRKEFTLSKAIRSAKLFTSGLGVYDLFINGERVGHEGGYEELKPGWSDYRYRVFYSGHDVTHLLQQGANALGVVVTSGWWQGRVSHGQYGSHDLGFIAKLIVTYDDGTTETLITDQTWQSSLRGALREGDIYDGEIYDARLETDWSKPGLTGADSWNGVDVSTDFKGKIDPFTGGYVQVLSSLILHPQTISIYEGSKSTGTDYGMVNVVSTPSAGQPFTLKKGQTAIIDFGQNMVGWVDFKVKGKTGVRMRQRFTEMLNDTGAKSRGNDGPGGSLYLANLRSAKAQLYYTLAGREGGEQYHPSTTFFGFRYLEITATDDIEVLALEGQPISSSTRDLGTIETSNADVNKLFSNIQWGQRGNLLSVPTDCPQRDERLGWTADTQVFSRTGMFNADMYSFYRKWMTDMRDGQASDGGYPGVAPENWGTPFGQVGWADAGIFVPWNIYLMYGDTEVLKENFSSMERYMSFLATQQFDGYKYNGGGLTWGDWLSFASTDTRYIAVAYYAQNAQIMARVCRALSVRATDSYARKAAKYDELYQNIKEEFRSRYITPTVRQTSQTAYLLALDYNLLADDTEIANFKTRLSNAIRNNGYKLSTGFLGTAIIGTTLSRFGLNDYAYDLLLQRQCPSWLYSVDQGATTIWERWNSYTKESGFGDPGMNSFNHYAYGAIGEWMYRYMAGISFDEDQPGFHHFLLQPTPDRRTTLPAGQELITRARATHSSDYGLIESAWQSLDGDGIEYTCTVPANSTATLRFPAASANLLVTVNGIPAAEADGVTLTGYENGCLVYEIGSGTYHFTTDGTTGIKGAALMNNEIMDNSSFFTNSSLAKCDIYDLQGRKVVHSSQSIVHSPNAPVNFRLKPGIYVHGGKKIVIK